MKQLLYISFFLFPILSFGQEVVVSGNVTDAKTGEPIVGATVLVNKTHNGTTTDFDGKYSLKTSLSDTLVFNFVAMKTQKIKVDKEEINVQLVEEEGIEAVIPKIIPKKVSNYSIKTISEKEIIQLSYKTIKGFVFENMYLADLPVPSYHAQIEVKGTKRIAYTDIDGKFEIEVNEGELLVINGLTSSGVNVEMLVSNKSCYKIYLPTNLTDDYIFNNKERRRLKKEIRKIKKRYKNKIKNGFYDCSE